MEERVQYIASLCKNKDTIPSEFIGPENEQPAATTVHGMILEMPVIDLKDEHSNHEENLITMITEASQDWGIFQVVNHGIPDEVIKELQKVGKEFFDLPKEEKELIAKTYESGIEGYGTMLQKGFEGKKSWGDHLFHKIWPPAAINYNFWPKNPPSYKETNEKYGEKVREISNKLLTWLSLGLGLEGHELKLGMGGEDTVFYIKINYYPPCPRPDLVFGSEGHSDVCCLTILVPNEVQGLQIFRDNHWYDVNCMPTALVILIGEQIEVLSNGKLKAVLHRSTVNKDKVRMSWPTFLEPPADFEVGPIPKLLGSNTKDYNNPSKYKTTKYKDYVYFKVNRLPM